jgi:hypothetical protein
MMKNLNKDLISTIEAKANLFLPGADQFSLPEKEVFDTLLR